MTRDEAQQKADAAIARLAEKHNAYFDAAPWNRVEPGRHAKAAMLDAERLDRELTEEGHATAKLRNTIVFLKNRMAKVEAQ